MKKYNRYKFFNDCVFVYPQDREDVYTILDYKWFKYFYDRNIYLFPKKDKVDDGNYYWCYREGKKTSIRVHSVICCPGCDHRNGNKADNREINLRPATPFQNVCNTKPGKRNTTGYKGVQKERNKFCVQLRLDGKLMYFGSFETAEEAAKIYDMAALKYFGEFAWANFDRNSYKEEGIMAIQPKTMNSRRLNASRYNNELGVKGVSRQRKKYVANYYFNGENIYIGTFDTIEEAARNYDITVLKKFGKNCFTNFPKEEYFDALNTLS